MNSNRNLKLKITSINKPENSPTHISKSWNLHAIATIIAKRNINLIAIFQLSISTYQKYNFITKLASLIDVVNKNWVLPQKI